jgi:hypothetical protein
MKQRFLLCCRIVLVWIGLIMSQSAMSHYLDIAQFAFFPSADNTRFRLEATLPLTLDPLQPIDLPASCALLGRDVMSFSESWRIDMEISCLSVNPGLIQTRWGKDGFIIRTYALDGSSHSRMLSGSQPGAAMAVPDWNAAAPAADGFWRVAARYLELGAVHVLIGWDHLAFVFCLTLLATGLPLLGLITAFTLGHSVSLALAHLGIVNLPIIPVEAVIALSVVFLARDAWIHQSVRLRLGMLQDSHALQIKEPGFRERLLLTVIFGLIHGLGFASVLDGLGVSATDTLVALVFFNIGVEVGQVAFVLAVVTLIWLLSKIRLDRVLIPVSTCVVGGMGMLWTVERVLWGG